MKRYPLPSERELTAIERALYADMQEQLVADGLINAYLNSADSKLWQAAYKRHALARSDYSKVPADNRRLLETGRTAIDKLTEARSQPRRLSDLPAWGADADPERMPGEPANPYRGGRLDILGPGVPDDPEPHANVPKDATEVPPPSATPRNLQQLGRIRRPDSFYDQIPLPRSRDKVLAESKPVKPVTPVPSRMIPNVVWVLLIHYINCTEGNRDNCMASEISRVEVKLFGTREKANIFIEDFKYEVPDYEMGPSLILELYEVV